MVQTATNSKPTQVEELAAAIREAAASDRVRITGSDSLPLTHFEEEERPVRLISTLRMNKLLEHGVPDMMAVVQAGITLEALQKQLAWHNQWLPVDPPVIAKQGRTSGSRTIGGLIASNSLGPLRFGMGDWRLLIMGMRWVDATGQIIRGGGRTVKNVAGYSSPRMMIGSCGSLGAIAEVTLRTFTRPEDEQCAVFYCPTAAVAEELLAAVMVSPTTPAYVQAIGGRTFQSNTLGLPGRENGIVLVVGFTGREEICTSQVVTVRGLKEATPLESIAQGSAPAGRLRHWMAQEPEATFGGRIHCRSFHVAQLIESIERAHPSAWIATEAGTGVIRVSVADAGAQESIQRLCESTGSNLLVTQGSIGRTTDRLAQRIKQQLDPRALFGHAPLLQ